MFDYKTSKHAHFDAASAVAAVAAVAAGAAVVEWLAGNEICFCV